MSVRGGGGGVTMQTFLSDNIPTLRPTTQPPLPPDRNGWSGAQTFSRGPSSCSTLAPGGPVGIWDWEEEQGDQREDRKLAGLCWLGL